MGQGSSAPVEPEVSFEYAASFVLLFFSSHSIAASFSFPGRNQKGRLESKQANLSAVVVPIQNRRETSVWS